MNIYWIVFFILFIPYLLLEIIPVIKTKIKFLYFAYKVKKMANKQTTPEAKSDIMKLSNHLKDISKQEKF